MANRQKYARVEDLQEVKQDIKDIKENHLPHLACEIAKLRGNMKILIPLVCAIVGGIAGLIYLSFF